MKSLFQFKYLWEYADKNRIRMIDVTCYYELYIILLKILNNVFVFSKCYYWKHRHTRSRCLNPIYIGGCNSI